MAKQELTLKNFEQQLGASIRSIKKQTEGSLQAYLVFAGLHYQLSGDSGLLSKCVNACIGVPALATNKMIGYIVESSDLKSVSVTIKSGVNAGNKQKAFKREQAGNDVPRKFAVPAYDWTKWETPENVTPWDELKAIHNLIKKYRKELPKMKGAALATAMSHCKIMCEIVGDDDPIVLTLVEKKAA